MVMTELQTYIGKLTTLACKKAKERDEYICRKCGAPGTEVHHVLYRRNYPHLKFESNNLITLCNKCHRMAHRHCNPFRKWFAGEYPERWEYLQKFKRLVKRYRLYEIKDKINDIVSN